MWDWSELKRVRNRLVKATTMTAIFAILLFSSFPGSLSQHVSTANSHVSARTQAPPSTLNTTRVFVTPNITDTSITGGFVKFSISINKTAVLSGFSISLLYDNTILLAQGVDYSSGIFGTLNPAVQYDCFNNIGQCPGPPDNLQNEVTLQLAVFGQPLSGVSGVLFNVNFKVIGSGLSTIHIFHADLSVIALGSPPTIIPSIAVDGYFSNKNCGSQICRPLTVKLHFNAVPAPVVGRLIRFNATVTNPNNDALQTFEWGFRESGTTSHAVFTSVPEANHTYANPATYVVTLTVNDTYGVVGFGSININVARVWVNLVIGRFTVKPQAQFVPGTLVNVTVQVVNQGTSNVTSDLNVFLDLGEHGNKTLTACHFVDMAESTNKYCPSYILDTSEYRPNVYPIIASVQLAGSNSTFYLNDTSGNTVTAFLQIIQPLPANAGLSLTQVGGLGIGVIIVAYAAFAIFRRVFRTKLET